MADGNGDALPRFDVVNFASTLGTWVEDHETLLEGVAALRGLGEEADDAVLTVLTVPTLRTMRLGWELWEALAEGNGEDPELLLVERLALDTLEMARRALWGEIWPAEVA